MAEYICFIPARAGSKRVPKKNIKHLNSIPLINYTIDFALQISDKKNVYISSDSEEIEEISSQLNVQFHKRPSKFAQDKTSMLETTLNFIETNNISDEVNIILLQPTNPFRDKEFFLRLKNLYESSENASAAISLLRCSFFHPSKIGDLTTKNFFKTLSIDPENNIDNHNKKPYYVISGTYYIVNVQDLKNNKSFVGDNPVALEEDASSFCNIDTPMDFKMAEIMSNKSYKYNLNI